MDAYDGELGDRELRRPGRNWRYLRLQRRAGSRRCDEHRSGGDGNRSEEDGNRRRCDERRWARRLAPQRGLTAMELVATLGITALLATLAVPGFAALQRSTGLTATANELLGALHLARSSAGRRGIPATVCLTANERTCLVQPDRPAIGWLVFHSEGSGAASQPATPDAVFHTFHLPSDITVSGSRTAITFWPVARAGSTGTFELCDIDDRTPGRSIVVSQTGRPRVATEAASCGR